MCGIAGFYGFRDDDLIKKISTELEHRGPDGEGYDIDDTVTLMNRRLAIIDVKGGDQPIYNEDKSISIIFVGEVYNYRELTKELIKKGHTFKTKSDTEMIVHAYEQWGESSFDRFNGMFVFALYDKKKKKLILARDHFGIKPLYYSSIGTERVKMIFSSEIKPIIYSGLIKKRPNDRIIYRYLKYRVHEDNDETFFEGIYRLLPGQMLVLQNGKKTLKQFSNLESELQNMKDSKEVNEKNIRQFKKELIDAVRLRLISEVPVGSCLSGGLDSSTIVSVVNKLLKEKVEEAESVGKIQNTFSAVFPNQSNDEEKYIDALLSENKVMSHKVKPTPEEFFQDIQDFVKTQEEPTISTGPYAQYKVMQLAHKKITVALDGQGSDEMMAGYLPYYFVYLKELLKKRSIGKFMWETFMSFDVVSKYLLNKLIESLGLKQKISISRVLNISFQRKFQNEKFIITNNDIKKRLIEDIFHNSLQPLLRYEDRNAMRFSIEGRVPFLDFNLLRHLFSLDSDAIIKHGWNKYILRESTKDLLPPLINRRRNKIGFTTPEYEWFLRMKNKIYSIFLSESFAKRKYFNRAEVLKAFQQFIEGKIDDTMVFWRMLNLELWMREFFDSPPKKDLMTKKKTDFDPNERRKLEIKAEGKMYYRFPVKTDLFQKGDNFAKKIAKHVLQFNSKLDDSQKFKKLSKKKWFVVISEKVVAISQGRAYFIWDIHPSFFANTLSKFVTRTPYGIGLGSPWTMQLAIGEVGLFRILLATLVSTVSKPFGIKGLFYKIAGSVVRSIDGPTEYSLYPSNVSAKLGPEDPQREAENIKSQMINHKLNSNFRGVAIIDANDLGQNILGNSTGLDNKLIENIFKDNPMGQSNEQTPLTVVFCV
ncbi:asparagine synthase (glutamine-hydrolyzing) [Candidatus Roizmanbacteria bacterium]|nr:asparagine synthase (glutamine-hydrolyzing) [Candidatus Roizmanbacteria bacterium]